MMKKNILFPILLAIIFVSSCNNYDHVYHELSDYHAVSDDQKTLVYYEDFSDNDKKFWPEGQLSNCRSYRIDRGLYQMGSNCKASLIIESNLAGDCDDFSILIASVIESIGGKARINKVTNGDTWHAFPEVLVGEDLEAIVRSIHNYYRSSKGTAIKEVWFTKDSNGKYWLNLDWRQDYPGGKYYNYTARQIYYPR